MFVSSIDVKPIAAMHTCVSLNQEGRTSVVWHDYSWHLRLKPCQWWRRPVEIEVNHCPLCGVALWVEA